MLCSNCKKNPASVHFKSVVNDEVTQMDLCASCAQEKGISLITEMGLPLSPTPFKSLSEIIAQLADEVRGRESREQALRCSHCGLAYSEFQVRGRFGCAHCYDAFYGPLQPLLQHIHGHTQHNGKTYRADARAADAPAGGGPIRSQEIKRLEHDLKEAIRHEQYERAAQLRDQIRHLKEHR